MTAVPELLFIVGPTAGGKSDFAVELCESESTKTKSEILNCDSVQFFAGVEIGAAKPSADLLARVPHHLIGHLPLGATYTAGEFRRDALQVIEQRAREGVERLVAVGGSGFYVQALEKGMYDVPKIPDEIRIGVERDLEEKGLAALHLELKGRDPEAAVKINPADQYRIGRALEVLRADVGRRTLTQIREQFATEAARNLESSPTLFRVRKIGLFVPRDVLRDRVVARTRKMLENGLVEEVRGLRAQGLHSWSPLQSVGYKEVGAYLDGTLSQADLEPAIVTSTMQLAKRQMTWFKRDVSIEWR
jgi:tRNA dimethylallyltransferase